jgi:hypothetical protein
MPTRFENEDSFSAFIGEIYLRSALPHLIGAEKRRVVETLVALYRKDEVPFSLDYVRLNISARKQ